MRDPKIKSSYRMPSHRWLWCAKVAAVILSLLFAFPHLPVIGESELNFISTMFYIALMGLIPKFGWTIPCLTIGFWLTPIVFAFRVNGSSAEDLTAAITGGIIGLAAGVILDIQKHQTSLRIANLDANVALPDSPNAG